MSVPNNKFWCEFIDIYQNECDELWNTKNDRYNNKRHRCKAWEKIVQKLREIDENSTVDNARRRINSMRSCFRRELQRVRRSTKSCAGTNNIYVPTLWYYDKFHFLTSVEDDLENSISDEETALPPPRPKKRKFKEERQQLLPQAKNMKSTSLTDRDEADVFAECWALCYRKLTAEQQIYAKKAIDDIFIQGRLGNLTLHSFQPSFEQNISMRRSSTSFGQSYPSSSPPHSGGQPYLQTHFAEIHLTESPPSNTRNAVEPSPTQNGIDTTSAVQGANDLYAL